jgi:hypothetical protein
MALASRRIKQYDIDPAELDRQVAAAMGAVSDEQLSAQLHSSVKDIATGQIVKAVVDSVDDRTGMVVMDIGGKSEGSIPLAEFGETLPQKGETYEVFYDGLDENDTAVLSKKRADRLRAWERVSQKYRASASARSRAVCSSTSKASTCSCPRARSTCAARTTSRTSWASRCARASSRSTRSG